MMETLYRRPLPATTIAFSSPEGRHLFSEALAAGGMHGYFPLAEQFHTQSDPAFCGLGSLVVALNALGIDPGRLWKGPWRWFAEEMLDCCVPTDEVQRRGLALDELACLARCNGAAVELAHATAQDLDAFRGAIQHASRGEAVMIVGYDRVALEQTGGGHFSPVGGYHAARDLVLLLDVARFKYPPHWVSVEQLWRATHALDETTHRPRGWMLLRPRATGTSLGFTLTCAGDEDLHAFATRLTTMIERLPPDSDLATVAHALAPHVNHVELREPTSPQHREALAVAVAELHALSAYPWLASTTSSPDGVLLLLLVLEDRLPAPARAALADSNPTAETALGAELAALRLQLAALRSPRL